MKIKDKQQKLSDDVLKILTSSREVTYSQEMEAIRNVFRERYGFECKMTFAHEIILAIRKVGVDQTYIIMDYVRYKRYGFSPNN